MLMPRFWIYMHKTKKFQANLTTSLELKNLKGIRFYKVTYLNKYITRNKINIKIKLSLSSERQ